MCDTYDEDMARAEFVEGRAEELRFQWVDDAIKVADTKDHFSALEHIAISKAYVAGEVEEADALIFQATCRVLSTWAHEQALKEYESMTSSER